ncbi:MAG: hypothetical protein U0271_36600 [Polyangiaceae bacterium]
MFAPGSAHAADGDSGPAPRIEVPPPTPDASSPADTYAPPDADALGPQQRRPGFAGLPSRPRTLVWEPGEVVPPGYAPKSSVNKRLAIAGAVVFGAPYLSSVITGIIYSFGSLQYFPLLAPVVGPAATVVTADVSPGPGFILVTDTLAQATGVLLFAMSFVYRTHKLVRTDDVALTPFVSPGFSGLEVTF